MRLIIAASLLTLLAVPAVAADCTQEEAQALAEDLTVAVLEMATTEEQLERYFLEADDEMGGELTEDQACAFIDLMIVKVRAAAP